MINLDIWKIFGIIIIVLLIIYWRKRNAVWGGLTMGIILGLAVTIFYFFKGNSFSWFFIAKGAILGTMIGFVAELLGKASDFFRKNNKK